MLPDGEDQQQQQPGQFWLYVSIKIVSREKSRIPIAHAFLDFVQTVFVHALG